MTELSAVQPISSYAGMFNLFDKQPQPLLLAASRAASLKCTMSGIPNRLNYCIIFTVYRKFTNVAAG